MRDRRVQYDTRNCGHALFLVLIKPPLNVRLDFDRLIDAKTVGVNHVDSNFDVVSQADCRTRLVRLKAAVMMAGVMTDVVELEIDLAL